MNAHRIAAFGSLLALAWPMAGAHEPVQIDDADKLGAAERSSSSNKLAFAALKPFHSDGVKGYGVNPAVYGPDSRSPELLRKSIADAACKRAVFGLVVLVGAQSFVGANDQGVFTKFRFRVVDDWRAAPTEPGRIIHLVLEGGEVTRLGERYRVSNRYADYRLGSRYILAAGQADVDPERKPIFDTPQFIDIVDHRVYPAPGWTPFAPGITVEEARRVVGEVVATQDCNDVHMAPSW